MYITATDIELIRFLSAQRYPNNKLEETDVISSNQITLFINLRERLKKITHYFKAKYDTSFGPFKLAFNRNPTTTAGTWRTLWTCMYKGTSHKQYAAQISFVVTDNGLEVGFYFGTGGRAMGIDTGDVTGLQNRLMQLGRILHNQIISTTLSAKYQNIFDTGLEAYDNKMQVTSQDWLAGIQNSPEGHKLTTTLKPVNGYLDINTIEGCIDTVIDLMSAIPDLGRNSPRPFTRAKTPIQRGYEAKRLREIGNSGELFVLEQERARIRSFYKKKDYPKHVASISDSYNYDILSIDPDLTEVYIEVKTTTRSLADNNSNNFFISSQENQFWQDNLEKYRLYRVYDIEGAQPVATFIPRERIDLKTNSFIATIR